jgi:hypothetical protein
MLLLLQTILPLLMLVNLSEYKRKLAALCHNRFFPDVEYHVDNLWEKLNLLTLHMRHRHSDAFVLIKVFSCAKYCPSALEAADIRVPPQNIRNLPCSFAPRATALPSYQCVSATNYVCRLIYCM